MIEEAIGISEYKIGMDIENFKSHNVNIIEVENREILIVYKTRKIWFFFNPKTNELDQLSLFYPFDEKTKCGIGIGSTIKDVENCYGKLIKNDGVYEPYEVDGIAFDVRKDNKGVIIVNSISVMSPYKFYGDLPEHIKRNLPGNKRKLP